MKRVKKLSAFIIAVSMMGLMALPALADTTTKTVDGNTVTAENDEAFTLTLNAGNTNADQEHTYQAYQIFSGDLLIDETANPAAASQTQPATDGKKSTRTLSNIKWGSGVKADELVAELKTIEAYESIPDYSVENDTSAAAVAEILGNINERDAQAAQDFADIVSKHLNTASGTSRATKTDDKVTSYAITGLKAGYYFVKDQDNSVNAKDDFYTRFILEVLTDITTTPKGAYPEVDKEVYDDEIEDADNEGYSEAADHDLYESFKFRLTATIPADVDLAKYDYYKVVFTDTMSPGVSFESIESVKIKAGDGEYGSDIKGDIFNADKTATSVPGDTKPQLLDASDNILNRPNYKQLDAMTTAETWTLTFNDLKQYITSADDLKKNITIQVVYNAHLNEYAKAFNAAVTNDDSPANNKIKLTFSNNPNAGGEGQTGETPEDTVWVFTYKINNTKYKEAAEAGKEFGGAGFTLYDKEKNKVVKLIYDTTKSVYRPVKDATEIPGYTYDSTKTGFDAFTPATSTTKEADIKAYLVSANNTGLFNIIGLDEGTYTLKETVVPAGYNKCDDIEVVITAATTENESEAGADLSLKQNEAASSSNLANSVINKGGAILPSTGGMGTTLFYIIGGALVAVAGILLVLKKRGSEN